MKKVLSAIHRRLEFDLDEKYGGIFLQEI